MEGPASQILLKFPQAASDFVKYVRQSGLSVAGKSVIMTTVATAAQKTVHRVLCDHQRRVSIGSVARDLGIDACLARRRVTTTMRQRCNKGREETDQGQAHGQRQG